MEQCVEKKQEKEVIKHYRLKVDLNRWVFSAVLKEGREFQREGGGVMEKALSLFKFCRRSAAKVFKILLIFYLLQTSHC